MGGSEESSWWKLKNRRGIIVGSAESVFFLLRVASE